MDQPNCLSLNDAARTLGIGRSKLYDLIEDGLLRPIKLGRRCLLVRTEIDRFLKAVQDGEIMVGQRRLRSGEDEQRVQHRERVRARRAEDKARRQATRVAP